MNTVQLRKMQKAAARAREQQARTAWRQARSETKASHPKCQCTIPLSPADLRGLGGGCTMPNYACPRLEAMRRRMGQ